MISEYGLSIAIINEPMTPRELHQLKSSVNESTTLLLVKKFLKPMIHPGRDFGIGIINSISYRRNIEK